ncbi:hypothetical protein [Nonomuraea sp. LPB2021202275-12-8]|uniref:hypothetical protein n=1 Tax=Nonomuraea sp. LPB2021202275-12-8 TaxID=3120159 RepID=UPI00300C2263
MTDQSWWADVKGAAAHWHELCDHAAHVAALARHANPDKMPVTDDYASALAELHQSVEGRALHQIHDATIRFSNTFDLSGDPADTIKSREAGGNEIALMGAVSLLDGARHDLDNALTRLPTFDD